MLRVWKTGRHRYVVECDACTSRGTPAHVVVGTSLDPKNAAARTAVQAEAQKMRLAYEVELRALSQKQRAEKMKPSEVSARVKELGAKHAEVLRAALANSPALADGVVETVEACPWCGAGPATTVQKLPEGAHEPPEWTATRKAG